MPKLINSYGEDGSLANAFQGFADTFGLNTPQKELQRQKAYGTSRDNRSYQVLQDAERAGGYDPNNADQRAAIIGLDKPVEYFQARRGIESTRFGAADPRATNAYVGAGGAYSGTAQGTRESEANRVAIENLRTNRQHDAAVYAADNTPLNVVGADGMPRVAAKSVAIREGMRPVIGHGEAQGTILLNDLPNLTPPQREAAGGYGPKNPSNLWSYRRPDGSMGNTLDGKTDAQNGQPITGAAMKLEGPNAEGLTGNHTVDQQLLNSRTAKDQFVAGIDGLIGQLSQPNADQAGGIVGRGGALLNDIRSQAEAATRLIGGESFQQAFDPKGENAKTVDAAMNMVLRNPAFVEKMQQLGIDRAKLQSQLQDLAYAHAKAKDPGGRVSNEDVRRSMETIAGSVWDPKVGIQTLTDLKQRVVRDHDIRERNTRAMYPSAKPAPQDTQPAAPAAVAPAQAPAVIKWGRDANGLPIRVQ